MSLLSSADSVCDGIGFAALANDVLGDPHALDRGRATATLVLDALAVSRARSRLADRAGTVPWRMGRADYLAAVATSQP